MGVQSPDDILYCMRRATLAALSLILSFACFTAGVYGLWIAIDKAIKFGAQTPAVFFAALNPLAWIAIAAAAFGSFYFLCMAIIIRFRWPP
jgi:hypothetical protein